MALLENLLPTAGPEELLEILGKRMSTRGGEMQLLEKAKDLECFSEDEEKEVEKLGEKADTK
eukprot:12075901-Prorocentrum_lima.AAC.1